jgi:hypothetical protein
VDADTGLILQQLMVMSGFLQKDDMYAVFMLEVLREQIDYSFGSTKGKAMDKKSNGVHG